jgi:Haem-binding domain
VRHGQMILAGLLSLIVVIGSAARSHSRLPDTAADPAAGIDADTHVPAPVMSTLQRACFDCHSDHTRWPWYASLPVASWLLERDVRNGRGQMNFSRWAHYNRFDRADLLDRACELAARGDMPLRPYRFMHREARLSEADIKALCTWSRDEAARLVEERP